MGHGCGRAVIGLPTRVTCSATLRKSGPTGRRSCMAYHVGGRSGEPGSASRSTRCSRITTAPAVPMSPGLLRRLTAQRLMVSALSNVDYWSGQMECSSSSRSWSRDSGPVFLKLRSLGRRNHPGNRNRAATPMKGRTAAASMTAVRSIMQRYGRDAHLRIGFLLGAIRSASGPTRPGATTVRACKWRPVIWPRFAHNYMLAALYSRADCR